ncbi:DMT family transporter [Lysinibacillus sp. NPDC093712]|uniref:DMT family transporter n=1 Tax=Lysinibacillus sp. NPDC093712 TaxID=3390579 RepID=UPI003CFCA452
MGKAWLYVGLTSFFELIWIYGFNVASHWWEWLLIIIFIGLDLHFLSKACEKLPTGTVYAIFAAIGTMGTTLMDILIFNQVVSIGKLFFIFILIIGVIGLKVSDTIEENKRTKEVI